MSRQINVNEESYKKFQAALVLTEEEEEIVACRLIDQYAHKVFDSIIGAKKSDNTNACKQGDATDISEEEQKRMFMEWFRRLTRNGKAYNPVTISGYAGRIENACSDPAFADVPVDNLFAITNLERFISIQKQIKACAGYAEFDAKSHNGFTAALRKYEDFLRFQANGETVSLSSTVARPQYQPSNNHRWTMEEDLICCERFLEYYVIRKSNIDTTQFLKILSKEVPEISVTSLRMKLQNIKYLSERAGLANTSTLKGLSQYSTQNERAFEQALRDMHLV